MVISKKQSDVKEPCLQWLVPKYVVKFYTGSVHVIQIVALGIYPRVLNTSQKVEQY